MAAAPNQTGAPLTSVSQLMGMGGDRLRQQTEDEEQAKRKKALTDAAGAGNNLFGSILGNYANG
jgi:hypothetical protein